MTVFPRALVAAGFALAALAAPVAAATLTERPSTLIFSGGAAYAIDIDGGFAFAIGALEGDSLSFEASGVFDEGTQGENPRDAFILVTDGDFNPVVDAIGLQEIEVGAGFLAILLNDLLGGAAGQFAGGALLAIFRDSAFPAVEGFATVELRSLDDLVVIPLPATAPLLLAALSLLAAARRREKISTFQ